MEIEIGTQETNCELFPGLPIGCSESLDGSHNHIKDDDTRIKHPALNAMVTSFYRKLGSQRRRYSTVDATAGTLSEWRLYCEI